MTLSTKWIKKLGKNPLCNEETKTYYSSMAGWFPISLKNIPLGSVICWVEAHKKYTKAQHKGNLFLNRVSSMHKLKCHRGKEIWTALMYLYSDIK